MTMEWLMDNLMNIGEKRGKWNLCEKFDYYYSHYYPYLEYKGVKIYEIDILDYMFSEFEQYVYENEVDIDCDNIDFTDERLINYCKQNEYKMLEYFDEIIEMIKD